MHKQTARGQVGRRACCDPDRIINMLNFHVPLVRWEEFRLTRRLSVNMLNFQVPLVRWEGFRLTRRLSLNMLNFHVPLVRWEEFRLTRRLSINMPLNFQVPLVRWEGFGLTRRLSLGTRRACCGPWGRTTETALSPTVWRPRTSLTQASGSLSQVRV